MSEFTLLTATDCHLCEHAKTVLTELGLEWREVHCESEEGQQLAASAPPMRPVLYDSDGNASRVRAPLAQTAAQAAGQRGGEDMNALWLKLKPHILSWHMLPCLVMLAAAIVVAVTTGQPTRVLGAVGCMLMMMVMMAAMGGHDHSGHSGKDRDN